MSNAYYEIVQLANGDFALQRGDGEGEPLVRIQFSDEVKFYLQDKCVEVARAMINSGIRAVGEIQNAEDEILAVEEQDFDEFEIEGLETIEEIDENIEESISPTVH